MEELHCAIYCILLGRQWDSILLLYPHFRVLFAFQGQNLEAIVLGLHSIQTNREELLLRLGGHKGLLRDVDELGDRILTQFVWVVHTVVEHCDELLLGSMGILGEGNVKVKSLPA